MVNEFCGFKHGVIGTDKMPADATLNNMKKADLIKLLHTAQHNYETLMWFYNNAVNVNMSQLKNNGWIPCSERLPEDSELEYFLVWCKGYFTAGTHIGEECQWYGIGLLYNKNKWEVYQCKDIKDIEVIAWQPLPQPYKEEGVKNG